MPISRWIVAIASRLVANQVPSHHQFWHTVLKQKTQSSFVFAGGVSSDSPVSHYIQNCSSLFLIGSKFQLIVYGYGTAQYSLVS